MSKLKWIVALLVAITLFGAPTLAYAQTGEGSSESTNTQSSTKTTDDSLQTSLDSPGEALTDGGNLPTAQTSTGGTPLQESPAESPQLTELTASGPTSEPNSDSSEPVAASTSASSPTATPPVSSAPEYVLVIWEKAPDAPKFPQKIVSHTVTTSTDVVGPLKAAATKCGTFYQSDLYAKDARTEALIAKGVLNGGDESWPLNEDGTMNMRYHTIITPDCPPKTEEPEVTPSPSTPVPSPSPTEPTTPPSTIPPSTSPTPSIPTSSTDGPQPESSDESGPSTESKATSTTTDLPTEQPSLNSSLAYTGSEPLGGFIFLGVLLLVLGFVLYRNRK